MKRTDFPKTLDGAKVLFLTETGTDFGVVDTLNDGTVAIMALAIAQYDNSQGTYLFACDKKWNVVGDLLYDSINEAKKDAGRYYETEPLKWMEITS